MLQLNFSQLQKYKSSNFGILFHFKPITSFLTIYFLLDISKHNLKKNSYIYFSLEINLQ
jgi:hypothetical protein